MKVKTSITLSSDLLTELDKIAPEGGRSDLIEKAVWRYLELANRELRNHRDLELLNASAELLNSEALESLSFQAPM